MADTCPECGAVLGESGSCQDIFDEFLVLEFTDPGYGEVHFLTVACFMIQHGRYSNEGLVWIDQTLRAYLEEGLTHAQLRRLAAKDTSSGTRTWKVTRAADAPPQPKIGWSMTIADVASRYQDAESYCELIKAWGRRTLQEMEPLLS